MAAPDWESDIGPANLDNTRSGAARQPLPIVSGGSTGIGARTKIAQYGAQRVEFRKHFTDLSRLILGCFFLKDYIW